MKARGSAPSPPALEPVAFWWRARWGVTPQTRIHCTLKFAWVWGLRPQRGQGAEPLAFLFC
jgi:hypothetical protein